MGGAGGAAHQFAAAIEAAATECSFDAVRAEAALEGADEGAVDVRRQITAAPFAIGSHFKHGDELPFK